ncbi:MAG: IS3 family transposase [Clostridia bacterium]|nr:IS3 family transposase [Clostridia bacterium]
MVIYHAKLHTYEEACRLIDEYIYFYNHQRIQIKTIES